MKAATIYNPAATNTEAVAYPNGMTRRQLLNKLVDFLLIAAIGVGAAAILLFLLALA